MVMNSLGIKMWRDLWRLRAQTASCAILIICGVALLVSEWSAYRSLTKARDDYYRDYAFADLFDDFKSAPAESLDRIGRIPGVRTAVARVSKQGLVNLPGVTEPAVGHFLSVPSGLQPRLNRLHLRKGRLPIDSTETEIVVHEGFAEANGLNPGDRFAVTLEGKREEVRVVGIGLSPEFVYALSPSAPLPDDIHFGVFWLTEKTLQRLLKLGTGFNSVILSIDPSASAREIKAEVDRALYRYGSLGAYLRDRQSSNMFVEDEISQQRVSSIFIPAIFLSIAAFLINIIASRLVALHRSQIATLKALGYTRWQVSTHYLQMILMMTLTGTIPGLVLGAFLGRWMSLTYESYFRFPALDFSISLGAAALGIAAGMIPGLAGAAGSIRSVFALTPAEAMRPLAPPAFHSTFLEKWNLKRFLSPIGRMAFRNLLQRPLRLIQVILSLAAALGIVVAAGSWSDMIEFLMKTQFQRLQKEDLSVGLLRPRPLGVLQELARAPGVIDVEGFRVVPVRLEHLNFRREIQITGWPQGSRIRELLDRELNRIAIPESGVLLSRFFETKWSLKAGDAIRMEVLEGDRRSVYVRVAGFSDELVGLGAHMKLEELWKTLGEQPGYNSLALKADPLKLDALYSRLIGSPEVGAVNLKNDLYKGFNDSFAKIIRTATLVLTIASLLIALGIIFNSVRVSFSERAWELASLRVLGFTKLEVGRVLITEVGIQVALSLVPGCLFGNWLTHLSMRLIHTETFAFPVVIENATYARGLLAVLLAFAVSGGIVYNMSGRLNPAEALKARD